MTTTSSAIEIQGLTKRFGDRTAVDNVDLTVPAGTAFGFLGHNGAGKTTLIRSLLGLTNADAGTMALLGHPVPAERAAALERVGAVVEDPLFYGHLSGRENLLVAAAVRSAAARERIPAVLARVGLTERAGDKVKGYSMGMRQRLGLARALLSDPELLILDEPTNGFDPGGMLEFRTMVRALVEQEGRTVFVSSHLLDEVQKMCDAAAIIDRGRVIAMGTIAELIDPQTEHDVIVGCDDPIAALGVLRSGLGIADATLAPDGIRVRVNGRSDVARINSALVDAGIAVWRIEPVEHSLEERFLALTSTLEAAA
jgi:ABC-2 type transport system ATP-binding protein